MTEKTTDKGSAKELDHRLAGWIACMPDEEPPRGLTAAVLRQVRPKRPGRGRRLMLFFHRSMVAPARPAAVGALIVLLIAGMVLFERTVLQQRNFLQPSSGPAVTQSVTLVLHWPSAESVAVIGSFNNWNPQGHAMHRSTPDAPWMLALSLATGRYAYAFLVDGRQVVTDPLAIWHEDDGFGGQNASLIVANGKTHENKL